MSSQATDSNDQRYDGRRLDIDLPGIWQTVWRKRNVVLGTTALCFALATVFVLVAKPRYTGEAKVLVENQENYFTRPAGQAESAAQGQGPDQEAIASQVQVVTSRDLGREAIRALGLKGNPFYDPLAGGGGLLGNLLSLLGLSRAPTHPEDRILDNYFDALAVFPVPKSRVLQIEFKAPDADLAAKGANTIADLYIDMQSQAKRERAKAAAESLGTLVAELRKQVAQSEARLEAFRASSGLMLGANNMTLPTQALSDINGQLSTARSVQAEAQARAKSIRDGIRNGRLTEMPDIAKDDLIRRISEQRINLRAQLALESRTLGPQHPRIKDLNAQLATLDADLRAAAERAARALENEAKIAGGRVDNLAAAVDQQRRSIGNASGDEVRLRELDRDVKLQKDQLEANITKYQEAVARQDSASTPGDARVISRAVAPQLPSFPKKLPIIVLATLAGLILSIGAVLMREFLTGNSFVPNGPDGSYAPPSPRYDPDPRPGRGTARMFSEAAASSAPAANPETRLGAEPDVRPDPRSDVRAAAADPLPEASLHPLSEAKAEASPEISPEVSSKASRIRSLFALPVLASLFAGWRKPKTVEDSKAVLAVPVLTEPVPQPMSQSVSQPKSLAEPVAEAEAPLETRQSFAIVARGLLEVAQADYATRVMTVATDAMLDSRETAYPLARELANEARTILIDFRRSPARTHLEGLSDLLSGEASFEDVIHRDRGSRLHVLEAGEGSVVIGEDLEAVIDALSQTYEFLVLSAPPVADDGITKGLAPAADFVCVVAPIAGPPAVALGALLVEAGAGEAIVVSPEVMPDMPRPHRRPMVSDAA
ncbi:MULTISPECIES: exopolysaccharide transport family protein [unclassified Beijerinckia]|uniref:exopolysaccharide transport family protein n=1 Tax=unclassified Beijerinckia TaxID=2638183 RepID=UPI00089B0EEB|nr:MULTISPECIES: exopolysaccharide transport family protein [unclassified Beijerinckia]MDH7794761.1 succinoglycan biosynthesis transport protein ExoP [Beijerinckia sp. GAS462]SEB74191.1 Uncharacterized protein involved in exopolysaccharide biosynthesis [Beijerinckia sp. 28-YEA-48]